MTEARRTQPTIATVPLTRAHLVQPELFNSTTTHYLPKIAPGGEAHVYDADEWQKFNGRRGIVTKYSYFSGWHTLKFEDGKEYEFAGREIMKVRR